MSVFVQSYFLKLPTQSWSHAVSQKVGGWIRVSGLFDQRRDDKVICLGTIEPSLAKALQGQGEVSGLRNAGADENNFLSGCIVGFYGP